MDWGTVLVLVIWLSALLLIWQRAETKRRRAVTILLLFVGFLTWYWADFRGLAGAFWLALVLSLIGSFLFWLLIGRYNPVGSSDDIQVIGMDD
ncbi:MAG: hypothetical protein ACUVSX_02790 [Aggregatilineales bacterium]